MRPTGVLCIWLCGWARVTAKTLGAHRRAARARAGAQNVRRGPDGRRADSQATPVMRPKAKHPRARAHATCIGHARARSAHVSPHFVVDLAVSVTARRRRCWPRSSKIAGRLPRWCISQRTPSRTAATPCSLKQNLVALAHLMLSSSEGRFTITYAPRRVLASRRAR